MLTSVWEIEGQARNDSLSNSNEFAAICYQSVIRHRTLRVSSLL